MDVSIIILNYQSRGLTLNCVKSIKEADWSGLEREIIVVDNDSGDSLGEILAWQHPEVKFIRNEKNLGMGAGNNVGIRQARGEYLAVMNPDTIAFKDTFKVLYNYLEANKRVGVAGPLQYSPDKTVQASRYRWHKFLTPFYRRTFLGELSFGRKDLARFLMEDLNHNGERQADWLLGSFLFCRAEALKQVGLFDERYFMYFEDTDLCRRLWQKGWQVVYLPAAKIIHNHLRESAREPVYKFLWHRPTRRHIASWFKYLIKWKFK